MLRPDNLFSFEKVDCDESSWIRRLFFSVRWRYPEARGLDLGIIFVDEQRLGSGRD
jgi:hypothetical protein